MENGIRGTRTVDKIGTIHKVTERERWTRSYNRTGLYCVFRKTQNGSGSRGSRFFG